MKKYFEDKITLITGGAGSIGSKIAKRLLQYNPRVVRVLDNNEIGLFELDQELQSDKIRLFVGDVKDKERINKAMEGVDIVYHAAASKQVPLGEFNPFEVLKTNAIGSQNVIDAAMYEEVEKFINISTDKAVNPINVMGATKLLAERLTVSANFYRGERKTAFSCVRFGNVFNTRGSVIPLFKKQIENGNPVTITDPNMTRFVMSISRAVDLVLKATEIARGGEIFIFKMPVLRIGDLGDVVVEELTKKYNHKSDKIKIEITGRRAGERLYEELMTRDEALEAYENEDMFVVLPQNLDIRGMGKLVYELPPDFKKTKKTIYSSEIESVMSKEKIRETIKQADII